MTQLLIIEDEALILSNVVQILTFEGFETLQAADGVEGVALARAHLPDVILCDIRMPRLDGYGVLETLRGDPATAAIPFVFMTAKTNVGDLERVQEMTGVGYLLKPFEVDDLLAIIKEQLARDG